MADTKLTQLATLTSLSDDDLILLADNVATTPVNKSARLSDLRAYTGTYYATTAAETAAGVTPTNLQYEEGHVARYGAIGDGTTDDTDAIQDAIDAVEAANGGHVIFPIGDYICSSTLTIDSPGVVLVGQGHIDTNGATRLTFSNPTGPAIRIKKQYCGLRDLAISANSSRRTASIIDKDNYFSRDDQNYGVWFEADDTGGEQIGELLIDNVLVHNQPNSDVVIMGASYSSQIRKLTCNNSNGHGFVIGNGVYTDRTNVAIAGVIEVDSLKVAGAKGHGILCGHPGQSGAGVVRLLLRNPDIYNCGLTGGSPTSFLLEDAVVYMAGDECEFSHGAINGQSLLSCAYIAGRGHRWILPRLLSVSDTNKPIVIANQHGTDNRNTSDIFISVGTVTKTSGTVAYVVDATGMAPADAVRVYDGSLDGSADSLVGPDGDEALVSERSTTFERRGTTKLLGNTYTDNVTIADDAVAAITPPANSGFILISVNPGVAAPNSNCFGLLYYDVGATSPAIFSVGTLPTELEVVSTDLTGTTGADAHLTVGAVSGSIKVENRLGASANVRYTLIGG